MAEYHWQFRDGGYLTQSPKAVEQQFRRMAFNVYAHNMDDHARNFSFICREGTWSLTPAYMEEVREGTKELKKYFITK